MQGYRYLVWSREDEEALLEYETCAYDVVRCEIRFEEGNGEGCVEGLTFRIGKGLNDGGV